MRVGKLFTSVMVMGFLGVVANAATYRVERSYPKGPPQVGKPTILQFSLYRGSSTDKLTTKDLLLEHDKKIHLLALDAGFRQYLHEHPEEVSPGVWAVPLEVTTPGQYRLWLQFKPDGEVYTKTVAFDDAFLQKPDQVVPMVPVDMTTKLVYVEGDYKFTLSFPGAKPEQHENTPLKFELEHKGQVVPVAKWDNYLGAKLHLVGVSANRKDFVHAHPGHEHEFSSAPAPIPDDMVTVHFMQKGYYGLFLQVKVDGAVRTAKFGIEVK